MKIYFLTKAPDATAYYRADLPAKALKALGHEVRVDFLDRIPRFKDSGAKLQSVEWADLVVVQRPTSKIALDFIQTVKASYPKKPVVGDYDDDYYSVPKWNPGYPGIKSQESTWRKMVREFDGITVSTDCLEDAFRDHNRYSGPMATIPNGFDFETFDAAVELPEFAIDAVQVDPKDPGKLKKMYNLSNRSFNELMRDRPVILWAGSPYHYADLEWLVPALKPVCEQVPEAVFLFVGFIQGNVAMQIPLSRIFVHGGAYPVSEFYRLLKSFKVDLYLAPLHPIPFNESKSNLKVMEAMAIGAYPVCSMLEPYEDDLMPEHEAGMGRLVPFEQGAWAKAIIESCQSLTENKFAIRHNAEYVRSKHSIHERASQYEAFFQQMLSRKA